MRKLNKLMIPLMLSGVLMSGCSQSLTVNEDMTAESTKESSVETTEATETAEIMESTESSKESDYILSDEDKEDLEWVLANCYYFNMGNDYIQKFSELSDEYVEDLLLTTIGLPDTTLAKVNVDSNYKRTVSKEDATIFLKDCFGIDINNVSFEYTEYPRVKLNGDVLEIGAGDYGSNFPYAIINRTVQDKETGIITLTGDVLLVDDSHTIDAYYFEATMQPSASSYFGGNTLLTFSYTKNTGDYAHIDTSRFGEGFWKIQ